MANAREIFTRILEGGIPSVVDGIRSENDPKPEQTAPTGTFADRISGLNFFGGDATKPGITQGQILAITALLVGALGVVWLLRK